MSVNATTKTPLLEEKEKRLEPKNWNGQGYMPVSGDKVKTESVVFSLSFPFSYLS